MELPNPIFQMKYWKAIWLNGLCMNVLYHGLIIHGYQFCFEDDGYMAFMDYNTLNSEGEPRIILSHDTDAGYIFDQVLADDLGDYYLLLLKICVKQSCLDNFPKTFYICH